MSKIKKINQRLKNCYYDSIAFGFYIGITNLIWPLVPKMPHFLASFLMKRKHRKVIDYLMLKNSHIIEKYKFKSNDNIYSPKAPIWVCWLQGEENMPDVPKQCLKSIKKHSDDHPVIMISLKNFSDYILLPQFILDKYEHGFLSNAHFADIIRTALLAERGGCWIDSTILMTSDILEEVFLFPFYSIKFENSGYYISENKWSNFFLASQEKSIVFSFVRDMFYEYLKKEERFIDYFMMDYFIYIGYQSLPNIRKLIDDVPYNNSKVHCLGKVVNHSHAENEFKEIIKDTYLHKLSWKNKCNNLTSSNKKTFWGFISE
jgi:hypothetical protein